MTKEEAIKKIKKVVEESVIFEDELEAFDMAIKALEQEPILDKIRAEILVLDDADYDFDGYYKAVTDALEIIDKYRSESEDKE